MAKVAKLNAKIITLGALKDRLEVSREAAHQIVKKAGIDIETPCSRCGTSTTLIKESDAAKLVKARTSPTRWRNR